MNSSLNNDIQADMSEALTEDNLIQRLRITSDDIDLVNEDKQLLSNDDNPSSQNEQTTNTMEKKQKSLVSVYDNSNENDEQQQQQIVVTSTNLSSLPLVGIIGQNRRAEAFRKRLILSEFPSPILCDINQIDVNSIEKTVFVSHETFFNSSPSIILICENFSTNFQHLLRPDKEYLIVDAREILDGKTSSWIFPFAPIQRAFGNLSDWEIENGSERVAVAIEQNSSKELIEFITNLKCFRRQILLLDSFSYFHQEKKSFQHCLFPFVATSIIFSLSFVISLIEHHYRFSSIFRQTSSICAATSLNLLALLLLIRPKLDLIEFTFSLIGQTTKIYQFLYSRFQFIRRWLQCRNRLAWFSLCFAILHVVFLLFAQLNLNVSTSISGVFIGVLTMIFLIISSLAHAPWISERLVWREYHLLTSYLPPICLLFGFIHVFLHWYNDRIWFTLKFFSMILPMIVLILRFILYGFIRPCSTLIQYIGKRRLNTSKSKLTKDSTLLMA